MAFVSPTLSWFDRLPWTDEPVCDGRMTHRLWKINCMEDAYPGMWQRWFKLQCVGVGWAAQRGFHLTGKTKESYGWRRARNLIQEIEPGDYVIVSLRGHRVGRIGEVTAKAVEDDDWNPLVPVTRDDPAGEMGRRIFVRWDLETGPDDREQIIRLPEGLRMTHGELRPTVAEVRSQTLNALRRAMNDPSNWVGLLSQFSYEKSLSDFIAAYPHRLEDGLLPHPNKKVRERLFLDRRRLDVILEDRDGIAVIVECKQRQPSTGDVRQHQHYLKRFRREEGQKARGILVHGGARKLRHDVRRAARRNPAIELVQFSIGVDFSRSG
jgi:hypothetical protein